MEIRAGKLRKQILTLLFGASMSICTLAQDIDPCRFMRTNRPLQSIAPEKNDTGKAAGNWGFAEFEIKPDLNFSYSAIPSRNCKLVLNTFNRFLWNYPIRKTKVELLAEQRLGGVLFPDSLRNLLNDEMRVQLSLNREAKKPMRPAPTLQADIKTALFTTGNSDKQSHQMIPYRGFLLPAMAVLSTGLKAEKPGKGSIACGIAGLKIDWLRKNGVNAGILSAFPNLISPMYRNINGGMHFSTQWSCALGKNLKLEHTSRVFKPLFPNIQKPDIELRHALVFTHAKGIQTSLRQSYAISQSLGTPADFSGEVVMGYMFSKQAGKRP
jgi:hypothetical protein